MALTIKDLALDPLTQDLLRANGKSDRELGVDMHKGWKEIKTMLELSDGRTPAREAYEDGYYGP
jgi:hypothetical protein